MKNPKVWQFYALFYKEQKNYAQAVKCYTYANKYDPDNLNMIKDLSNLLLYLGNYDDFKKYSLQCVTNKSSLSVNWVQYSLAEYFLKNYENALHLIDSVLKSDSKKGVPSVKTRNRLREEHRSLPVKR